MRIRYVVISAYGWGGTTRTVVNQANALCDEHDVEIASVYRNRERPAFAIDPRVRLVPLTDLNANGTRHATPAGGPARLRSLTRQFPSCMPHRHDHRFRRWDPMVDLAVLRYFRRAEDGILVTTRPGLNLLSARAAPRHLTRVGQDHMNFATYKPGLRRAIVRAYPRLDAVTVLTERDRQDYRQALGDSGPRLEHIPNGVPAPRFPPAALDAKVIVAAGRLLPQKGFDLLLDAFRTVSDRHPDWQLWIFGGGPAKDRLADQIDRLGLTGRAQLKGKTGELDRQFAAASIFVLSSRFEGLPMVLIEAMAAGLPAVAFDCPTGPAEIIQPGVTGLLAPPQDVPALAAGICDLIEDPARRRALGAAARQASERFSITSVRGMWHRLYLDLTVPAQPVAR